MNGHFKILFNNYFSCSDVNIRKEYVKLVEDVRDAGGEVKIFSSMHISGQRKYQLVSLCQENIHFDTVHSSNPIELAQLSGIAAILRFPMPELEDEDDNDEDNDTDDSNSDN